MTFRSMFRRGISLGCLFFFLLHLFFYPIPQAFAAVKTSKTASADVNADSDQSIVDPELKKERKIGRHALQEIEKSWPLSADPARLTRLTLILSRLTPFMEREIPYEVRIVNTEAINAFCLSGGFIFFTSGLLDLLSTDSEIAAIMAHEMIHADQKHSLKMAAQSQKISLAALAVILLSGGAAAPIVLAQVAQVAITNSYSIEFEKEADEKGMNALIKAGYWPSAMVTVMEKLMAQELRQPIVDYGIYMTHPEAKERVQSMTQKLVKSGLTIMRKQPLGLLRTGFQETKTQLSLTVDEKPVWGGEKTSALREALEQARAVLNEEFQMETVPYDLRLEGDALYLKNRLLAHKIPKAEPLTSFRTKLLDALGRAKRQHPTAKYFQQ